jgi:hypothetical protein
MQPLNAREWLESLRLVSDCRFILANGRDGYSWNFEKPTHESLFTPEKSEAMQTYFALHAKGNESRNSILHKCARADIVEGSSDGN